MATPKIEVSGVDFHACISADELEHFCADVEMAQNQIICLRRNKVFQAPVNRAVQKFRGLYARGQHHADKLHYYDG